MLLSILDYKYLLKLLHNFGNTIYSFYLIYHHYSSAAVYLVNTTILIFSPGITYMLMLLFKITRISSVNIISSPKWVTSSPTSHSEE